MKATFWTIVTIAVALLAFGTFGWVGLALALIVVGVWWVTIEGEDRRS